MLIKIETKGVHADFETLIDDAENGVDKYISLRLCVCVCVCVCVCACVRVLACMHGSACVQNVYIQQTISTTVYIYAIIQYRFTVSNSLQQCS